MRFTTTFEPFRIMVDERKERMNIAHKLHKELFRKGFVSDLVQIRPFDDEVDVDWANCFVSVAIGRESFFITTTAEFVLVPSDIEVVEISLSSPDDLSGILEPCFAAFSKIGARTVISDELKAKLKKLHEMKSMENLVLMELLGTVIRSILSTGDDEPTLKFCKNSFQLSWKSFICSFEEKGVQINQGKVLSTKKDVLQVLGLE